MDWRSALRQPPRRSLTARQRHPDAEGHSRLLHRRAKHAHLLCRHPQVLSRARKGDTAREDRGDRQDRRRSRHGHGVRLVGREHQESCAKHREPAEARRSARTAAAANRATDRDDQAPLPLDGRPPQRRNGPIRDADGARLSPRDRDVATHHADPQQRDRFSDARGRARRPRSQRRLVLSQSSRHPGQRRRGWWWRPRRWRAALLGQVRVSRQQPRLQRVADDDARAVRLVHARESAYRARPA